MKKKITWILVADGARADVYLNTGVGKGLEHQQKFESSRAFSREIASDKPGRGAGAGGSHAFEPRVTPHDENEQKFAEQLASYLGESSASYDRLVLACTPVFLGMIRKLLNKNVSEKISGEINKDLTKLSKAELAEHLEEVLPLNKVA